MRHEYVCAECGASNHLPSLVKTVTCHRCGDVCLVTDGKLTRFYPSLHMTPVIRACRWLLRSVEVDAYAYTAGSVWSVRMSFPAYRADCVAFVVEWCCVPACRQARGYDAIPDLAWSAGMMRVLVGCETSGKTRRAFAARGHESWSCDLLPSDDNSPMHLQLDIRQVLEVMRGYFDLFIVHPTCTYLCSSGLHWNKRVPGRAALTEDAIAFAVSMMQADIQHCDGKSCWMSFNALSQTGSVHPTIRIRA